MLAMYGGQAQYRAGASVDALAKEAYAGNADVYAAIETKATACAGVSWYAEKRVRGVWQRTDEHPILKLWERPNPRTGSTAFVGDWVRWRCIAGEAYITRNELPGGPPRELWLQPPGRMSIVPSVNTAQEIACYEYKLGGRTTKLAPELVMHAPFFNPLSDWYGQSPLLAAAALVDQATAASEFNLSLLQNGGVPPLFLTMQESLSDVEFKRFKKELNDVWGASKNAGLPQMLEGGMDVKTVGAAPKDMQMLEAQRYHALKFAQVIRVPAEFLSGADEKKYGNYADAVRALYTEGALPELDLLQDELYVWLAAWYGDDVRLRYDSEDIEALKEDQNALWSRADAAVDLTIDEKRALKGYDPLPNGLGASILIPFSLAPLGAASTTNQGGDSESLSGSDEFPAGVPEPDAVVKRKALNMVSEAKTAHWKKIDQQRGRLLANTRAVASKRLEDELAAVLKAVSGAPTLPAMLPRIDKAVNGGKGAWGVALEKATIAVATPFAEQTLTELEAVSGKGFDRTKAEKGWLAFVQAYVKRTSASKVTQITDTTKTELRGIVSQAIDEGLSVPNAVKLIEKVGLEQIVPRRSEMIARTEIVGASNAGSVAAAQSTELDLDAEWITTRDDRTREAHIDMDGETVPLGESFNVNGDEMEFPGDSARGASAGNVINCRCTVGYVMRGE